MTVGAVEGGWGWGQQRERCVCGGEGGGADTRDFQTMESGDTVGAYRLKKEVQINK